MICKDELKCVHYKNNNTTRELSPNFFFLRFVIFSSGGAVLLFCPLLVVSAGATLPPRHDALSQVSAQSSRSKTLEAEMLGICFKPLSLRELVALTLRAPGPPREWLVHSTDPVLACAS